VFPVVIGVTGIISKLLRQYLSNVPGKHEIKELQKTAILCTVHKMREVLIQQHKTYCTSEITLHLAQTVNREQLQQCVPQKRGLFQVYNCK
jgi:hypothetical protein